ncbi:hypothetical protein [Amycolatopsis sp.]|nr:hypothetical protein [Amycolatopsis sp.]HVV13923.1 hypothetical protein [Amycolatopsis sp.]
MGRHRFDENAKDEKWGGPALSEDKAREPQRHSRDKQKSEPDRKESERKR